MLKVPGVPFDISTITKQQLTSLQTVIQGTGSKWPGEQDSQQLWGNQHMKAYFESWYYNVKHQISGLNDYQILLSSDHQFPRKYAAAKHLVNPYRVAELNFTEAINIIIVSIPYIQDNNAFIHKTILELPPFQQVSYGLSNLKSEGFRHIMNTLCIYFQVFLMISGCKRCIIWAGIRYHNDMSASYPRFDKENPAANFLPFYNNSWNNY